MSPLVGKAGDPETEAVVAAHAQASAAYKNRRRLASRLRLGTATPFDVDGDARAALFSAT